MGRSTYKGIAGRGRFHQADGGLGGKVNIDGGVRGRRREDRERIFGIGVGGSPAVIVGKGNGRAGQRRALVVVLGHVDAMVVVEVTATAGAVTVDAETLMHTQALLYCPASVHRSLR